MELTPQQTQRVKQIELDIFKHFIDICDKLSLKYYVLGGTMLGAARHSGFIPWDDDIDVGMLRKDYEVFIKEAQKYLPEYYFLQTHETDPEYPLCFAKIRDSRTTYIETNLNNKNINHGVFFDIFPLDYYPDSSFAQRIFESKMILYNRRIRESYPNYQSSAGIKSKISAIITRIICKDYKIAVKKKVKLMKSVKSSSRLANICSPWGEKEIVPVEWFGDGVAHKFEGLDVILPTEYQKWLTKVYGNYMQLPPEEKRKTHHYTDVIDLDNSYTKYTEND